MSDTRLVAIDEGLKNRIVIGGVTMEDRARLVTAYDEEGVTEEDAQWAADFQSRSPRVRAAVDKLLAPFNTPEENGG